MRVPDDFTPYAHQRAFFVPGGVAGHVADPMLGSTLSRANRVRLWTVCARGF